MNNNQNNNMYGIPNLNPQAQNNQASSQVIPGANLTPIGPGMADTTSQVAQPTISSNMPVNPVPGIVTETSNQTNGLPPINNVPLNSNSNIPGIVNSTPMNNVNVPTNNLGTSTFDNGLGNPVNNQPLNPVMPEVNGAINNNSNVMPQPMNNTQIPNNNLGDATPLTNQSTNGNDEVVTVKQYIIYTLLCCIPVVGFIIMIMKAFGKNENKNISNLAKAQLLLAVIITVIGFVLGSLLSSLLVNMIS